MASNEPVADRPPNEPGAPSQRQLFQRIPMQIFTGMVIVFRYFHLVPLRKHEIDLLACGLVRFSTHYPRSMAGTSVWHGQWYMEGAVMHIIFNYRGTIAEPSFPHHLRLTPYFFIPNFYYADEDRYPVFLHLKKEYMETIEVPIDATPWLLPPVPTRLPTTIPPPPTTAYPTTTPMQEPPNLPPRPCRTYRPPPEQPNDTDDAVMPQPLNDIELQNVFGERW